MLCGSRSSIFSYQHFSPLSLSLTLSFISLRIPFSSSRFTGSKCQYFHNSAFSPATRSLFRILYYRSSNPPSHRVCLMNTIYPRMSALFCAQRTTLKFHKLSVYKKKKINFSRLANNRVAFHGFSFLFSRVFFFNHSLNNLIIFPFFYRPAPWLSLAIRHCRRPFLAGFPPFFPTSLPNFRHIVAVQQTAFVFDFPPLYLRFLRIFR